MDFDIKLHRKFEDTIIDYGIIKGNNKVLFIKAGHEGSMYGYENKYLNIACKVNKKYGYTVVCSSNPPGGANPLDDAMDVIEDYIKMSKYDDYEIYYMGYSNGGLIGAWYGVSYPKITRLLLINAPLMFNYHKTKESLSKCDKKVTLVYGSLDQSYPYVGLLDRINNDNVKYHIIDGEDHLFSKGVYDFEKIAEWVLF